MTAAAQAAFYDAIGYRETVPRPDGSVWTRPAEQTRFLFNWTQRFHVVVCPARASKSYSAAKKVLPLVLGRQYGTSGVPRPTRGWIVGPTYDLAEKEYRYLFEDLTRQLPLLGLPPPALARQGKGDQYILTEWGAEVIGKSADKPQSLLGEQLDWVLLSEAAQLPGEIWTRYLEPRLATTRGYALFPTTPDAGALWLHDLYTKGVTGEPRDPETGEAIVASYRWDVFGNPLYLRREFEEKRIIYGEDHPVFREQYLGEWTFYAGVVYGHDFDVARNVVSPAAIPTEWVRIRAIDFGYRDPFVCLWFAITPDGGMRLYREYYQAKRNMAHHAQAIKGLTKPDERILYTVADSSEPQAISDLRRLGLPCLEAKRDRRAGRMLVGDYLRDGRLTFVKGACPETLRELHYYRWDRDRNKEGAKEATLGDDHAMDALRYAVMSRPQPQTPRVKPPENTFSAIVRRQTQARLRQGWTPLGMGVA